MLYSTCIASSPWTKMFMMKKYSWKVRIYILEVYPGNALVTWTPRVHDPSFQGNQFKLVMNLTTQVAVSIYLSVLRLRLRRDPLSPQRWARSVKSPRQDHSNMPEFNHNNRNKHCPYDINFTGNAHLTSQEYTR